MNFNSIISSTNERTNTIKRNVVYSTIIRGINILISLILIPMTINYVNSELYGIWLSLSSIVSWLGFLDIGFGLGLRNKLTTAIAFDKYKYGKILVSTTYAFMTIIFTIVGVLAYFCCNFVNWAYLLNISSDYNEIVTMSFQIAVIAFCIRMILQIVTNVSQAYQMTALANAIDMIGNILSLIFVWLLTKTMAPSLIYLSGALCLAPLVALLFANSYLYLSRFHAVAPSLHYVRSFVLKDITSLGSKFFLIQIICVILYQATNFIISHFCGPEQVTVYNIAYKYLYVVILIISIIYSPVWSALSDAYAKKDYIWMQNIYRKIIYILFLSESFLFTLIIISPLVYKVWIGNTVAIPFHITLLIGIYMGILLIGNTYAMIVNGMGVVKLQTYMALLQGIIYIPLIFVMANVMKLEGIIISLIIVAIPSTLSVVIQVPKLLNQKAKGIFAK